MDTNAGQPVQSPPLGIQPRKFWLKSRAHGLALAIARQYDQEPSKVDTALCAAWTSELNQIALELGKIQQEAEYEAAARKAAKEAGRREMSIAFQTPADERAGPGGDLGAEKNACPTMDALRILRGAVFGSQMRAIEINPETLDWLFPGTCQPGAIFGVPWIINRDVPEGEFRYRF